MRIALTRVLFRLHAIILPPRANEFSSETRKRPCKQRRYFDRSRVTRYSRNNEKWVGTRMLSRRYKLSVRYTRFYMKFISQSFWHRCLRLFSHYAAINLVFRYLFQKWKDLLIYPVRHWLKTRRALNTLTWFSVQNINTHDLQIPRLYVKRCLYHQTFGWTVFR